MLPPLAQNTSITDCLADQGRGRDHNSLHFLPERTIGLSYSGAAANIPPINKMNPRANERSSGPTFPRSPLSFRTAGFPRYGCKADISDGAFPDIASLRLLRSGNLARS